MIELSKSFVAATDEVWRLQNGSDAECVFFQEMADHGHYGKRPGSTRQGIYVCAPSGEFLASVNSNDPNRVLATLHHGLRTWNTLSEKERRLPPDAEIKPQHRWEESYPTDGLVLNMFTRDLPGNGDPDSNRAEKWNQDRVWFSNAEARMWLPREVSSGIQHDLPELLRSRLMRFHLVDTVNGQTSPFSTRHFQDARMSSEITNVDGSLAHLRITGTTRAESTRGSRDSLPHGVATRLLGQATYDLDKERFTQFELVAVGSRWGRTTYNGRRRDTDESPVGFVFRLASPEEPRIAPAFLSSYRVDWIVYPTGSRRSFDPSALFDRADSNQDGSLVDDEISERMREHLDVFDSDRDGSITRSEFESGIRRVFNRE